MDKLRSENIVWAVSEDYSYVPVLNIFDKYDDNDMDFYKMMLLGYLYKKIDMEKLLEFLSMNISKTNLKNAFLKLVEIYLDDCFAESMILCRPGAYEYRQYFYKKIVEKYSDIDMVNLSVEDEIEYIYSSRISGNYIMNREATDELITFLRKKNKISSTYELIENLNACFLKFFYANYRSNGNNDEIDDFSTGLKENKTEDNIEKSKQRLNFKMKKKHIDKFDPRDMIGEVTIESAEFTKSIDEDEIINDERLRQDNKNYIESKNDRFFHMVESRFGESIYPRYILDSIENEICNGIHKSIKIHYTDGKFIEGKSDKYYVNVVEKQRQQNIDYYKENELLYRRAINELKSVIQKKFIFDDEDNISFSNSGKLVPSRIWKNKYFNNDKIFMKNNIQDIGSITVDILLDTSASQMEREEYVSSQAYVIAEALTSLNIPTRVVGFCNFFNYTVMTQYRDYNDSKDKNINVFNFKASGSNRDGLVIKFISNKMNLNEEDNKILIVLSDGRPNDRINLGIKGFSKIDAKDYEGDIAIKDTAQEIFNLKMLNIHVLGVFTGEEEDLEYEKKYMEKILLI